MYEFVNKKEYQPIRNEIEEIIKIVQRYMRKHYDVSFQFQLIGSGSRHLITRVKNGNSGFDFDYNLILPTPNEYDYNAKYIKQCFIDAFKYALQDTSYSNPKDSTSAITIKVVDKNGKRVEHSCDFAIIYYDDDDIDNGYYYLRNNKNKNYYSFEQRRLSVDYSYKLNCIEEYNNGWNWIRDEYLKLKNRNRDVNKRSFVLYLESINNVFNQINQVENNNDNMQGYWNSGLTNSILN